MNLDGNSVNSRTKLGSCSCLLFCLRPFFFVLRAVWIGVRFVRREEKQAEHLAVNEVPGAKMPDAIDRDLQAGLDTLYTIQVGYFVLNLGLGHS